MYFILIGQSMEKSVLNGWKKYKAVLKSEKRNNRNIIFLSKIKDMLISGVQKKIERRDFHISAKKEMFILSAIGNGDYADCKQKCIL